MTSKVKNNKRKAYLLRRDLVVELNSPLDTADYPKISPFAMRSMQATFPDYEHNNTDDETSSLVMGW